MSQFANCNLLRILLIHFATLKIDLFAIDRTLLKNSLITLSTQSYC